MERVICNYDQTKEVMSGENGLKINPSGPCGDKFVTKNTSTNRINKIIIVHLHANAPQKVHLLAKYAPFKVHIIKEHALFEVQ